MVNEVSIKEDQNQTKQLHAVVAAHGRAQKELKQSQLARFNLHMAWRSFLTQAVTQWEKYGNQFQEQDKQVNDRVKAAEDALKTAKENLSTMKAQAGADNKDEQMMSEEESTKDLPVNHSDCIQTGLANLQSSLNALKSSAEQMVEEEQHVLKRPRIEPLPSDVPPGVLPSEKPGFG